MSATPVDAVVRECDDRDWAPLAKTEELPNWKLQARVLPEDQPAGDAAAAGTGAP